MTAAARAAASTSVLENIGASQTLREFLATVGQLTPGNRQSIVDQALAMIEQVYVHLPMKKAMHAVDPVQSLKLLRLRLGVVSERQFHNEMIAVFTSLRDLHTNYILPEPFQSRVAVLPFQIEQFYEGGERKYVVTQVAPFVNDPHFKPGVVPTYWNGVPIDLAVERNANREAGSNPAAHHMQGLASMTNRWMGMSLPPDDEWVDLRYTDGGKEYSTRFDWLVIVPQPSASGVDPMKATGAVGGLLGIDVRTEIRRRVLKLLFSPQAVAAEKQMAGVISELLAAGASLAGMATAAAAAGADMESCSVMPDVFSKFCAVRTPHGTFGYVRINTFNAYPEPFVQEFLRIVATLPQNGLIIDVRGNGGGIVAAGETLLQVLTPRAIEPEPFSFICSPLTQRMTSSDPSLAAWKDSVEQSTETGATFSQGFPLTPPVACNAIGQKYQGPVVLVTNSLCYSTTDMFSAGFQDHEIGKVLGVDDSTGAGGANVWTHDFLINSLPGPNSPFRPLPGGASFRVAIRRSTRVGTHSGTPVEDLGVAPDEIHWMTKNDVLNGNVDLINHAASLLAGMPTYTLSAAVSPGGSSAAPISIKATTKNLDRLDVFINQRPRLTIDVTDGATTLALPEGTIGPVLLELCGFKQDRLVVRAHGSPLT